MIFELVRDFADALGAVPGEHLKHRMLELLDEAIRRDIHFIARHPTTLFQCMWNTCWWYDCPEAAEHYKLPEGRWPTGQQSPPWLRPGLKLSAHLQAWKDARERVLPDAVWIRSRRPPELHLGTGLRAVLAGHSAFVSAVVCSRSGEWIATGSGDRSVRVWDTQTGSELVRLLGHQAEVLAVDILADEKCIAGGATDGRICIWNALTGGVIRWLASGGPAIRALACSSDGRHIAVASGCDVRIHGLDHDADVMVLRGHADDIRAVACSPNGDLIATGGNDCAVRVWNLRTGDCVSELKGHVAGVLGLDFCGRGKQLASCSLDGTVRTWDLARNSAVHCLPGNGVSANAVALSEDATTIASGFGDGTIRVWDARTGQQLSGLQGHPQAVSSIALCSHGSLLVSGSWDATARIWSVSWLTNALTLCGHREDIRSLRYSPDGTRIASGSGEGLPRASSDMSIRLWDALDGTERRCLAKTDFPILGVCFSPDSNRLASACTDRTVSLWDVGNGENLGVLRGHKDFVAAVAVAPDGKRIASASYDGTIRVWNVRTLREVCCLGGAEAWVRSLAFSLDGRWLAGGSQRGEVLVWDSREPRQAVRFRAHRTPIDSLALSKDGSRLVTGSVTENTMKIWDWRTGRGLQTISGSGDVASVAAGAEEYPWMALSFPMETVVVTTHSLTPVGWYPTSLRELRASPSGQEWIGARWAYMAFLRLEGISDPRRPSESPPIGGADRQGGRACGSLFWRWLAAWWRSRLSSR